MSNGNSAGMILAWCPGPDDVSDPNDPCHPCKPKPPPPRPPPGYPPWNLVHTVGHMEIEYWYQHVRPYSPIDTLWGGHGVTFGDTPYAGDGGLWSNPPYTPPGQTVDRAYYAIMTVSTSSGASTDITVGMSGPEDLIATDQALQWIAYHFVTGT